MSVNTELTPEELSVFPRIVDMIREGRAARADIDDLRRRVQRIEERQRRLRDCLVTEVGR